MISVDVELRANVNFATGSVSTRFPDCAEPHCGMTGTVIVGGEDSEFSSFGLVKGTLDSIVSVKGIRYCLPRLPSRQLMPKDSNNEAARISSASGRS
jgi:hypothetical protein